MELLKRMREKYKVDLVMSEAYRLEIAEAGQARCRNACPGLMACPMEGYPDIVTYTTAYGYGHLAWSKSACSKRVLADRRSRVRRQAEEANLPRASLEVGRLRGWQPGAVREYEATETSEQNWLYIYGGMGRGKTTLAGYIGLKELELGRSVRFENVAELMMTLHYSKDPAELMKELMRVDTLILDDVGSEYKTGLTEERLYIIIDGRYRARSGSKRLIVTSNASVSGLIKEYGSLGGRIADRLTDRSTQLKVS